MLVYILTQMKPAPTKQAASVSAKTLDLQPLVELWMAKNPGVNTSHLVRRALKSCPDLRAIAGRRFAHLVTN